MEDFMINKLILEGLADGTEIEKTALPLFQITYIESSGFGVYVCEDENENQFNIKGIFMQPLIVGTYMMYMEKKV